MSGRKSIQIKKEILLNLQGGKSLSFAELERKVNSNWQTIRTHCTELKIFGCIKIKKRKHHSRNNKPYFEISLTKRGIKILSKI